MAPMAKLTFKAILDWFMEIKAEQWIIYVQASQFDSKEYLSTMSPASGMITLNISAKATRGLDYNDEEFWFKSRIKGVEVELVIPFSALFCATDPTTGIPNMYPYFEDCGNEYADLEVPAEPIPPTLSMTDLPKGLLEKLTQAAWATADNPSPTIDMQPVPSLNDLMREAKINNPALTVHGRQGDNGVIYYDFGNGTSSIEPDAVAPKLLTQDTLETKLLDRHWYVIEGGRQKPKASMPWIDEVYRAKLARRAEAELNNDRLVLSNEMKSTAPAIRSDGSTGQSSHFPDLDVAKCVWVSKRIPRPNWMLVIEGGKNV